MGVTRAWISALPDGCCDARYCDARCCEDDTGSSSGDTEDNLIFIFLTEVQKVCSSCRTRFRGFSSSRFGAFIPDMGLWVFERFLILGCVDVVPCYVGNPQRGPVYMVFQWSAHFWCEEGLQTRRTNLLSFLVAVGPCAAS